MTELATQATPWNPHSTGRLGWPVGQRVRYVSLGEGEQVSEGGITYLYLRSRFLWTGAPVLDPESGPLPDWILESFELRLTGGTDSTGERLREIRFLTSLRKDPEFSQMMDQAEDRDAGTDWDDFLRDRGDSG